MKIGKRFHLKGIMEEREFKSINGAPYNQIWERGNIKVKRYTLMGSTTLSIIVDKKQYKVYGINVSDPNRETNINNFISDLDELLKTKDESKLTDDLCSKVYNISLQLDYISLKLRLNKELEEKEKQFLKLHNII